MRLPATPITPTVVFDLDGTLVHTVPDVAAALDIALAPYKVAPTSIGEAASMMGDGLSQFFWHSLSKRTLSRRPACRTCTPAHMRSSKSCASAA
jgi:phosphoglycolate phosphatase